ncbi:MAG: ABC transporter ATP-binding protein [Deltaproteobacteria bacterium]|nr:ABC transporter ATP-binding protein [Deltaproteobacteria bacterium]
MQKTNQPFRNLLYNYRRYYIAAVVFAQCAFLSAFSIPIIIKNLIDGLLVEESVGFTGIVGFFVTYFGGKSFLAEPLLIATLSILFLFCLTASLMHFTIRFSNIACENIVRDLRNGLYAKLQNLSDAFFSKSETGDLIQRCTSDIATIRTFLSSQLVDCGRIIVMIAMVIPVMFIIDVEMALLSLVTVPFIIAVVYYYFRLLVRISIDLEEDEGRLTTVVQENLTGIRVVRAFARQAFEREKFAWKNRAYQHAAVIRGKKFADFFALSTLLAFLQTGTVLVLGSWMVINNRTTLGTLVVFLSYSSMVVFTFRILGMILSEIGGSIVAIARIDKILLETENTEAEGNIDQLTLVGEIQFDNVSFSYTGNDNVLKNISFKIKAGETVAIVGPSGSGKTTIIRLLLRTYDCQQGRILFDGRDAKDLNPQMVRSQIGTSLQEPFLFSTTIKSNIKIAKEDATDFEVTDAAKTASIHETVQNFNDRYESEIGEKGVSLSGGQRQRLAMARGFVKRPQILMLDDSLSAVDTKTEREIVEALANKHQGVTTILVTHRLSCCINTDRILVLENGELVAQGPHKQLLQQDGFYKRLWAIQKGIKNEPHQKTANE